MIRKIIYRYFNTYLLPFLSKSQNWTQNCTWQVDVFCDFLKTKKMLQISFRIRKWIVIQHNQLLVPETYETPPPECSSGGGLSGMTFINFLMSAIAVGANLISNINSNQNNNNNNNNDNNDNVANFNFVNNNNGGNNQNTIQICKYSQIYFLYCIGRILCKQCCLSE